MDVWSWKSWYVTLVARKGMDFGLVLWWTFKKFRNLVLIFKSNNEIKIERFWFVSNEIYELWTFIWWKVNTFFQKSITSWPKIKIMLKFSKNVESINSRRTQISMEKKCLKLMHYYYLITKTISRLEKLLRKWIQNELSNLPILVIF
jgi:hypothetical protein